PTAQNAAGYPQPFATEMSAQGYPQLSPGALYQLQPQPELSLTGQIRLLEVDELPPQYRIGASRRRLITYIVSGPLALSPPAAVPFVIIRSIRETTPSVGALEVNSIPGEAIVKFDGTLLPQKTSLTIDGVAVGSRHILRVELPHYVPFEEP